MDPLGSLLGTQVPKRVVSSSFEGHFKLPIKYANEGHHREAKVCALINYALQFRYVTFLDSLR